MRIAKAIPDGQTAENNERNELDHVYPDGCFCRSGHSAIADVTGHDSEERADNRQAHGRELSAGKLCEDIPDQERHHGHHNTGVDPVEQVRGPAGGEFRQTRQGSGSGLFAGAFLIQKSLLRKVSDTGKACFRVYLCQLRVRKRCEQGDN